MIRVTWDVFSEFLIVDKGHSQNKSAIYAEKSRFQTIVNWFSNKEWNKDNFRKFLLCYKDKAQGTQNKYISMGKLIDSFLNTDVSSGIKCKVEKLPPIGDLLTPEEIEILANIKVPYARLRSYLNQRQKTLILFQGTTGCRLSELANLRWDDIFDQPKKHVIFRLTKNGSDRKVAIGDDVFQLLTALPHTSGFVFTSCKGGQIGCQEFNQDLKVRLKLAGISKKATTHTFRHSFATTMIENGVSDTDICAMAGWNDPKMLLRYRNSDMNYFTLVSKKHPLLISELNWEKQVEVYSDIVKRANGIVDNNLNFKSTKDSLVITIGQRLKS